MQESFPPYIKNIINNKIYDYKTNETGSRNVKQQNDTFGFSEALLDGTIFLSRIFHSS